MDFDIKKIIEQVTEKIKGNGDLMAKFKKDPIKAIESVIGIDLPDDQLQGIAEAVKGKLFGGDKGDKGKKDDKEENLLDKIGGLFGKK